MQKELSNTRHRYREQDSERTKEISMLKAQNDEQATEIRRLNKALESDDRDTRNYKQNLEINQKELEFLRHELRDAKELVQKVVPEGLQFRDNLSIITAKCLFWTRKKRRAYLRQRTRI